MYIEFHLDQFEGVVGALQLRQRRDNAVVEDLHREVSAQRHAIDPYLMHRLGAGQGKNLESVKTGVASGKGRPHTIGEGRGLGARGVLRPDLADYGLRRRRRELDFQFAQSGGLSQTREENDLNLQIAAGTGGQDRRAVHPDGRVRAEIVLAGIKGVRRRPEAPFLLVEGSKAH